MWTSLRHFFDIKYVFNRFAPVAENQPYVIFGVFLLLSLLLLFVCLFVRYFILFFFLNVENLV